MRIDPEDEVFNKAETRYSTKLAPRSDPMKAAAWVGNWALTLVSMGPDTSFPIQDRVVVVDRRTGQVVLTRGGNDVPSSEMLEEVALDLKSLSIRQFRTKWGIQH